MKPTFPRAILTAALALALGPAVVHAESDTEVTAHRAVLDLAGAFTNDGFKLRDGDYTGTLAPGQAVVIQVNLYAGNQYWFAVSTADSKSAVSINLYDETGKLVKTAPYASAAAETAKQAATDPQGNPDPDADTNRAAAGYSPDTSGPYYLRIANPTGTAATYCLIYSYK
jgi:hypothetical protein